MKTALVILTSLAWLVCEETQRSAAQPSQLIQPPQTIAPLSVSNYDSAPLVPAPEIQPVGPGPDPKPRAVSFRLKPTAASPEQAVGSAEMKSNVLKLHLAGIGTGRYEVEALKRPNDERISLGTVTIMNPTLSPDRQTNDNKNEASAAPEQTRIATDAQFNLPGSLPPQSIQKLELRDQTGTVVLAGKAESSPPPVTANPSFQATRIEY